MAILTGIQDSTNTSLKYLHLGSDSLTRVSPDIVAGAAVKLERLQAHLSSPQLEAILTGIAGSQDSKLRELTCTGADISGMDPEILSEALVKLETVGGGRLSPGQVLALFSRISESPNLRLTKLDLDWNISMVPPEMFAGALSRLERVQFWRGTGVTADQLESLFLMLFSH